MRKLPGVESVDVSLERAITDVWLRPGNTVTLDQLRKVIKNNGFNAEEADITVVGKVSKRGGQPVLSVTGTELVLILVADPKNAKDAGCGDNPSVGRMVYNKEVSSVLSPPAFE